MVEDVATGDPLKRVCLHCARRTVSPITVGKYDGLARYLRFRGAFTDNVHLNLARIDGVIRENLPMEAYRNESWWTNSRMSVHGNTWLDVGWRVRNVDLEKGEVIFEKFKEVLAKKGRSKIEKAFTPVPARPLRRKLPSKTKIAMLNARFKNLERQRLSGKAENKRSTFEKRLYRPYRKNV